MRALALEQLRTCGEYELAVWKRIKCYQALAEKTVPLSQGPSQAIWLDRFERSTATRGRRSGSSTRAPIQTRAIGWEEPWGDGLARSRVAAHGAAGDQLSRA